MMRSYVKLVLVAVFAVLLLSTFAAADSPGDHPAYLHAVTALRNARSYLHPTPSTPLSPEEERAIREIDDAIGDIKRGINDQSTFNHLDWPKIDPQLTRVQRLQKALDMCASALATISQGEQDSYGNGLKRLVMDRIGKADAEIHHALDAALHR